MFKSVLRFSPLILSFFYGSLFAYFISSSSGEQVYGMLYNLPAGPGWWFLGIFTVLGSALQGLVEWRSYLQRKTPRQPSLREQQLTNEVARLKAQVDELHRELARHTPMAM